MADPIVESTTVHNQARMQRIGDSNQFMIIATDQGLTNIPSLTDAQRKALIGSNKGGAAQRHIILLDRVEDKGTVRFVPTRAFTGDQEQAKEYSASFTTTFNQISVTSTLNLNASGASVESMPENEKVGLPLMSRGVKGAFTAGTIDAQNFIQSTSRIPLAQAGNLKHALALAKDPSYTPSAPTPSNEPHPGSIPGAIGGIREV